MECVGPDKPVRTAQADPDRYITQSAKYWVFPLNGSIIKLKDKAYLSFSRDMVVPRHYSLRAIDVGDNSRIHHKVSASPSKHITL